MGVALSDDARSTLERAAKRAGHSIAEEIRRRLERTFEEDLIDPETRKMMNTINLLADLVSIQTGHKWYENPAAASVMKHAIDARLVRYEGGDGEAEFLPDELPHKELRLLSALPDHPRVLGAALATIADVGDALGIKARAFGATFGAKKRAGAGEENSTEHEKGEGEEK